MKIKLLQDKVMYHKNYHHTALFIAGVFQVSVQCTPGIVGCRREDKKRDRQSKSTPGFEKLSTAP